MTVPIWPGIEVEIKTIGKLTRTAPTKKKCFFNKKYAKTVPRLQSIAAQFKFFFLIIIIIPFSIVKAARFPDLLIQRRSAYRRKNHSRRIFRERSNEYTSGKLSSEGSYSLKWFLRKPDGRREQSHRQGKTSYFVIKSGQMIFFSSAACLQLSVGAWTIGSTRKGGKGLPEASTNS